MKKIIFFDIDGTLLPYGQKELDQKLVNAIKTLKTTCEIIICTGRTYKGAEQIIKALNCDSYIVANGQHVVCKGKLIREHFLDEEVRRSTIHHLQAENFTYAVEDEEGLKLKKDQFSDFINSKLVENSLAPAIIYDDISKIEKVYNIWAFNDEQMVLDFRNNHDFKIKVLQWRPRMMQIFNYDDDKATGIECLLHELGSEVDFEQSYAFGDGINDIAMFKYVKNSVAMNNGKDEVKNIATFVSTDCDQDGVLNGLKHFKLVEG